MNLKWVIATQAEWDKTGLPIPPYARRFNIDTPTGSQEVILQHFEPHALTDEGYEALLNIMPSGNFLSDRSLQYLLPIEEVEDALR